LIDPVTVFITVGVGLYYGYHGYYLVSGAYDAVDAARSRPSQVTAAEQARIALEREIRERYEQRVRCSAGPTEILLANERRKKEWLEGYRERVLPLENKAEDSFYRMLLGSLSTAFHAFSIRNFYLMTRPPFGK
jgi:hypothetical protein